MTAISISISKKCHYVASYHHRACTQLCFAFLAILTLVVPSTKAQVIADPAADYIDANTLPAAWSYHQSNAANGGNQEVALATGQSVGNIGNTGFGGAGQLDSASVLGSIQGGSSFALYSGAGHNGVEGTDILIQPGNYDEDAFIIIRYHVSTADLAGGDLFNIIGSFRDLQGGNNDSVDTYVFQNNLLLFQATGSAGNLNQGDGTFNLTNIMLQDGDRIDFVVGNNGGFGGDETALQASIELASMLVDDTFSVLPSSTTLLDVVSNDSGDWNLNTLQITSPPSNGTANAQSDGTIEYIHRGIIGNDSFSYSMQDLSGSTSHAEVTVIANNGNKVAYGDTLNFPDTPPDGGWTFPDAFPGISFSQPTCVEHFPGDPTKLIVTERAGNIYIIHDIDSLSPYSQLFMTVPDVRTATFCGLRGVAFHPDFATNGEFYVGCDRTGPNSARLSRFIANDPTDLSLGANASSEQVLLQMDTSQRIHRINRMLFGPNDGYLYVAIGDDGNFTGPAHSQQITDEFWSSVLRIDVDKKAGNFEPVNTNGVSLDGSGDAYYSIPAGNPYVTASGGGVSTFNGSSVSDTSLVRTEMYCIGFRNPWKIGFVPDSGELWVADVGAAGYEKFNIMPKGGNAGWGHFEGTAAGTLQTGTTQYPSPLSDPPAGVDYIQPVMQYTVPGNTSGGGVKSIVGGAFYESTEIAPLTGAFVFADYTKGDIWYMHRTDHSDYQSVQRVATGDDWGMDETGMATQTISESSGFEAKTYEVSEIVRMGSMPDIIAMVQDLNDGSILMLDYGGEIRRLTYNEDDGSLPQTLTETGIFTNLQTMSPNAAVIPYDLNLRFWSDHADKTRYFALKNLTDMITYSEDGFWQAPEGGVWVKHFDMDLDLQNPGTDVTRLETRVLVKTERDFYALSYRWNEAQDEADLVDSNGVSFPITVTEADGSIRNQTWSIPSRGDCRVCHTNENGVMLGFNTRQLNLSRDLADESGNFLELLYQTGYLDTEGAGEPTASSLPKYYKPNDTSANLEERARSYLAVNCAYCHYEGTGISVGDAWKGDPFLSIEDTHLLHGEGIGFAVANPADRYIVPGNTNESMVLSLMSEANGYSRMPPLATEQYDQEGIDLIIDWINNYANAKPTIDQVASPIDITENAPQGTQLGVGAQGSDMDAPDPLRGSLTYSITDGNDSGYFDIDTASGAISIIQAGIDFEEASAYDLTVSISDNFAPNPGSVTANVTINLIDVVNDDSQGDGIHDEWAISHFGLSYINPNGDSDSDGVREIFEFWGDSDPNDSNSRRGLILEPVEAITEEGNEGYVFEWTIRADLTLGTHYFVQGSSDLDFSQLAQNSDFSILSTTPVDNGSSVALSRIRVKVPTSNEKYFIRLTNTAE